MNPFITNSDQELSQLITRDLRQRGGAKQDFSLWRSIHKEISPSVQIHAQDPAPCSDSVGQKIRGESAVPNSWLNPSGKSIENSSRGDQSVLSSREPEENLGVAAEGTGGLSDEALSKWEIQIKSLGSIAQILKRIQEMSLNEGLKQFGLDPKEWRLQRLARDVYRVEHVRDQGFSFVGKVQGTVLKPLKWKSLTLEAI